MITKKKRFHLIALSIVLALIVGASSFLFELEPSASEESQRGTELFEEFREDDPLISFQAEEVEIIEPLVLAASINAKEETSAAEAEFTALVGIHFKLGAAGGDHGLHSFVLQVGDGGVAADAGDALLAGGFDLVYFAGGDDFMIAGNQVEFDAGIGLLKYEITHDNAPHCIFYLLYTRKHRAVKI